MWNQIWTISTCNFQIVFFSFRRTCTDLCFSEEFHEVSMLVLFPVAIWGVWYFMWFVFVWLFGYECADLDDVLECSFESTPKNLQKVAAGFVPKPLRNRSRKNAETSLLEPIKKRKK